MNRFREGREGQHERTYNMGEADKSFIFDKIEESRHTWVRGKKALAKSFEEKDSKSTFKKMTEF